MAFFDKIKNGLKKTRESMMSQIDNIVGTHDKIDDEFFEELEEILVMSDVGINTAIEICDELKVKIKENKIKDTKEVKSLLKEIMADMLSCDEQLKISTKPSIILVIGVNGVGKTTTIGKLASLLKDNGKNVLLSAADTFRAAAIEQLEIWANRSNTDIIKQQEGSDAAAVVFDSISAAKSRNTDVIICDTAGRLHNKKNLMEELAKINRIIDRELPDSDKEVLLVLDATTGQNAVSQAREFKKVTGLTGIILTKLDGTAKGGVVLAINRELGIPVKFIGVGEQIDDLQVFNAVDFINALFPDDIISSDDKNNIIDEDLVIEDENEEKNENDIEVEESIDKFNTQEETNNSTNLVDEFDNNVPKEQPKCDNDINVSQNDNVFTDNNENTELLESSENDSFDDENQLSFIMATGNLHKVEEIKRVLDPLNIKVFTAKDKGINLDDVEETGTTFMDNAIIKARAAHEMCGLPVIADDSGLSVDILNGEPGVYSARYAGEGASDNDRIDKLLSKLEGVKKRKRKAHFTTAICCILPNGEEIHVIGECKGRIATSPQGDNGFGYDPIFMVNDKQSFAQLTPDEKDRISHRGNALRAFDKKLRKYLKNNK